MMLWGLLGSWICGGLGWWRWLWWSGLANGSDHFCKPGQKERKAPQKVLRGSNDQYCGNGKAVVLGLGRLGLVLEVVDGVHGGGMIGLGVVVICG